MNEITIHSVVRNEPFVYYAIKAVYDEADKILLYDTGSYDAYTLKDIDRLLDEDFDKKITFESVPMETDQTMILFTSENMKKLKKEYAGRFGLGDVRQMQIDDTKTDFFMVVDGDEIHYRGTVKRIKEEILPKMVGETCWARLPVTWFCELNQSHTVCDSMGRIFKTEKICMDVRFPEMHIMKGHHTAINKSPYCLKAWDLKPFVHFESYLKPWRRPNGLNHRRRSHGLLPEVMIENDYFIKRFEASRETLV